MNATKRKGKIKLHETSINIWEEGESVDELKDIVFQTVKLHLRARGFRVIKDPHTKKHFPIIADSHSYARKGDLECKFQVSGRHLEIKFFQNVRTAHSAGGYYAFDHFEEMPYLIGLQFQIEAAYCLVKLSGLYGWDRKYDKSSALRSIRLNIRALSPVLSPLDSFNKRWAPDRFERDAQGWPTPKVLSSWSNKDREGVDLTPGVVRYFRERGGRILRGKVYPNINGMWGLYYGPDKRDRTFHNAGYFFTLQPDESPRRSFPKRERVRRVRQGVGHCEEGLKLFAEKLNEAALSLEEFGRAMEMLNITKITLEMMSIETA